MMNQLIITSFFGIGFISFLFLNEYVFTNYPIKSEHSRKIGHIFACLSSLLFVFTLNSHWYVLILGVLFFLILYFGKKYNLTKSIDSVERKTVGSFVLPISIYFSFLTAEILNNSLYFILPILILGLSDPLANFFGNYYQSNKLNTKFSKYLHGKTIIGSFVFFLSTFIISIFTLYYFEINMLMLLTLSLIIAFLTSLIEIISPRGLDNLSIPLLVILILFLSNS